MVPPIILHKSTKILRKSYGAPMIFLELLCEYEKIFHHDREGMRKNTNPNK